MEKELEELIQKRRRLIEAHEENDFTDGIHALLTDLYPDTAHFIYELLQNAEDMNATEVHFHLYSDGVDFEHNGTKRNFNVADIDAITNIGHNAQKKDDPTSIGKFGVGFKAVFAYTATPEIHSGQYHFRIRDYFVPEFDNVEHVSVTDEDGVSWTKFRFPFNNPDKSKEMAYAEVHEGLAELKEHSVLFLRNIKTINYKIDDNETCSIKKELKSDHIYQITYHDAEKNVNSSSEWLYFDKQVKITDEQGNLKTLYVAVSYYVEYYVQGKYYIIKPAKDTGKTFIYFPAEKEYSGLRFYINAPFASTVARDSIRNCRENENLMNTVAELVVESLFVIKEEGMLNDRFLEVLPNKNDNIKSTFSIIRDSIFSAFIDNELLPLKKEKYIRSSEVMICSNNIANLFQDEKKFTAVSGITKHLYVLPYNTFARNFVNSVVNRQFGYLNFEKILTHNKELLSTMFREASDEWLLEFYKTALSFCNYIVEKNSFNYHRFETYTGINEKLMGLNFIKGNDDGLYKPNEVVILPQGVKLINNDTSTIKPVFSTDPDAIKLFKILGIKEYGPKLVAERILSNYKLDYLNVNITQYFKDLLTLARYDSRTYGDIDFSKYYLFKSNNGNKMHRANDLFEGDSYDNKDGEIIAKELGINTFWNGYKQQYYEKEMKEILLFAEKYGLKKGLEITKANIYKHPDFYSELDSPGKVTNGETKTDYTIIGIDKLLEIHDINVSRIIWNMLYFSKSSVYREAVYAPNASARKNYSDSTLVYYLKNNSWIPDLNGNFHYPKDITLDAIHPSFEKKDNLKLYNSVLNYIGIGEEASVDANEKQQAVKYAEKHNSTLVCNDELQLLREKAAKYDEIENKRKNSEKNHANSVDELYATQTKKQKQNLNGGDDFIGSGAVNNKERRERNIAATFKEKSSEKASVQRKLFSKIVDSNKEEKLTLKNWYNGHCQMCDRFIMGWDGEMHFEARNIIMTSHLDDEIRNTLGLAWNSLSLCPFCAAKFEVCSRNMEDMPEQIRKQEIYNGDDEKIIITMELAEERQEISFVPKHFLSLQKGLQLLDEYLKKNSEI